MKQALKASIAPRPAERGFTLVELMIAILIGLFLTGGLLTLVQAMKRTSTMQSGLSQLQDSERMAMTLIADVVQSAGYYPNPTVNTADTMFPIGAPFTFIGQTVSGTGNWNDPAPGNSISVRYVTGGTIPVPPSTTPDNTIDCTGNTHPAQTTLINTFSILPDPSVAGAFDLACVLVVNNNPQPPVYLVSGVTQLQVYYGVRTNPGVSNNSVDTYLDANAVGFNNAWGNVISVMVKVTFVNPLYGTLPGQSLTVPQTIPFTRVIDVMNKAGVST